MVTDVVSLSDIVGLAVEKADLLPPEKVLQLYFHMGNHLIGRLYRQTGPSDSCM